MNETEQLTKDKKHEERDNTEDVNIVNKSVNIETNFKDSSTEATSEVENVNRLKFESKEEKTEEIEGSSQDMTVGVSAVVEEVAVSEANTIETETKLDNRNNQEMAVGESTVEEEVAVSEVTEQSENSERKVEGAVSEGAVSEGAAREEETECSSTAQSSHPEKVYKRCLGCKRECKRKGVKNVKEGYTVQPNVEMITPKNIRSCVNTSWN